MPRIEYPGPIQELIRQLRRLPGIGPRSAERIGLWLVQKPDARPQEIASAINQAAGTVHSCGQCGFFAEQATCVICRDETRDRSTWCVVEQATDILPLERTGKFQGLYHVLQGKLSPLDHIGPEDLRIDALIQRVRAEQPREVVLALGADVEGEATAYYLADLLRGEVARITRIAQGMPAGLGLDNADELTIARAFSGRTEVPGG